MHSRASLTGPPAAKSELPGTAAPWPRLLDGSELLGRMSGSGLRDAPYLVRRCDGQVVQLSRLLYVIAGFMDGRGLDAIAKSAGRELDVRMTADQVAYVAEKKLAPLGLIAYRDGTMPTLQRRNALLALKFRVGVVPEGAVNALAWLLQPLFAPPLVILALVALVACDVWLVASHGVAAGLGAVIQTPGFVLAVFILTIVSLVIHEWGHAAACRYGGARPGRIGIGIYLVWPVFYTDVTDSYRLSKRARLRTDLGGVYFNALCALAAAGAFFITSFKPLLIVVVSQQLLILDQFLPWIRLDGYHIVSDLIGITDLFARIKPVMKSLLPGRRPDPRVTELKPWARAAVTVWVLTTITALAGMAVIVIVNAGGYLRRGWVSLVTQIDWTAHGARIGSVVDVLNGALAAFMLILPVVGIALTFVLLCRGAGSSLAVRSVRRLDLTLAARDGDEFAQLNRLRLPSRRLRRGNTCSDRRDHPKRAAPLAQVGSGFSDPLAEGDSACAS